MVDTISEDTEYRSDIPYACVSVLLLISYKIDDAVTRKENYLRLRSS